MAGVTMEQVRSLGDLSTLYKYEISFVKFPNIDHPSSEDLNLRCVSTDQPTETPSSVEINIHGHTVSQRGVTQSGGTISLTFVEALDNMVSSFIADWKKAQWDSKTGKQMSVKDTEATIKLFRLDGNDEPVYEYTLFGCTVDSSDAGGTLDGSSNDFLKPSLTLKYVRFEEQAL